jgi:translation initiation factor IF-2
MSKIRVYELAKEAGMSSKALADKLLELGYDIKGHSSSVDEKTAAKIRSTVLKSGTGGSVTRRTEEKKPSASPVRRPTTVIRRRPKAAEQSEEDLAANAQPEEEPTVVVSARPESTEAAGTATIEEATAQPVRPEIAAEDAGSPAPLETATEKMDSAAAAADEQPPVEIAPAEATAAAPRYSDLAGEVADADEIEVEIDKKAPPRKPMARVVRTIELPGMNDEEVSAPKRRPAPAIPVSRRPTAPGPEVPAGGDAASRAKKKAKKGVPAADDSKDADFRRGGKKGQKNVKFTHFAQDYQAREGARRGKKGRRAKPVAPPAEMKASKKRFKVYDTISVGDLAQKMKVKASDVIARLMGLGVMATINQPVDTDTAMLIATDFGYEVEQGITEEIGIQMLHEAEEGGEQQIRPPVVTVMGHVDHGKTSILDAIRKTDVALGEAGGITQHIGAYHVRSSAGDVTFVDTPGHAAFTEMRSRGAQVTDIVILVVAADDGVMDQTREAIHHAQAADVPIIVAVNKIDKENADVDRVKRELSDLKLMPEDWGGDTMYVETSAKQNIGIDNLLEAIQILAEVLELRADVNRKARGRVVEAQLHKGRGPVATVLIQDGTLNLGDYFIVGQNSGKVRAMLDDKGRKIKEAGPSIPVEVQGLSGVPSAGDEFIVVTDEKMAKNVSQVRALKARENELGASSKISLDRLFEQMNEGDMQELRVVLRADVQGTLEAFGKAAEDLSTKDIKVRVLHEGSGTITESDVLLASASDAVVIGFNVRPSVKVKELAIKENVDIRSYDVIYHALDDIRKAMVGMLEPTFVEEVIGLAEVREVFSVPKIGTIAGCAVINGKITRSAKVRVLRDGVVIFTGKIESLRRFKDDVKEVLNGYECGIGVEKFNDIKVGDSLEAFVMNEVAATL